MRSSNNVVRKIKRLRGTQTADICPSRAIPAINPHARPPSTSKEIAHAKQAKKSASTNACSVNFGGPNSRKYRHQSAICILLNKGVGVTLPLSRCAALLLSIIIAPHLPPNNRVEWDERVSYRAERFMVKWRTQQLRRSEACHARTNTNVCTALLSAVSAVVFSKLHKKTCISDFSSLPVHQFTSFPTV